MLHVESRYLYLLAPVVALAWVSHIAADLTNRTAVAVLWPFRWGPFQLGVRQRSIASLAEEAIVWLGVLLLVAVELGRFGVGRGVRIG